MMMKTLILKQPYSTFGSSLFIKWINWCEETTLNIFVWVILRRNTYCRVSRVVTNSKYHYSFSASTLPSFQTCISFVFVFLLLVRVRVNFWRVRTLLLPTLCAPNTLTHRGGLSHSWSLVTAISRVPFRDIKDIISANNKVIHIL